MVVPAVAALLTVVILLFVIYLLYLVLGADKACVSAGKNCFDEAIIVFQTNVVLMATSAVNLVYKNYHYLVTMRCRPQAR
jgi:hypothetical protein